VHPSHSQGTEQGDKDWLKDNWPGEDIGPDRKYETAVFLFGNLRCSEGKCACNMPIDIGDPVEMSGYNTPREANIGHRETCEKYAQNVYS